MRKIFLIIPVCLFILLFSVASVFCNNGNSNGQDQGNKQVSQTCVSFITWFNNGEQNILIRLSSTDEDDRDGAAQETLEHPQNHTPSIVSKALEVAYEDRLYSTIEGISDIVLNTIDNDEGMFNKYSNACDVTVDPQGYKFELSVRIEAAFTLGDLARDMILSGGSETGGSNQYSERLNTIIATFESCLTANNQSVLLEAPCAEASGNTYSTALEPILQSIVNDPQSNSTVSLAAARSLTQIENFTEATTQAKAGTMARSSSEADPPSYITEQMIENAMNYLKQFIPQTY